MKSPTVEADSNANVLPNCIDNLKKLSWMKIVHELYIYGAKTQDVGFSNFEFILIQIVRAKTSPYFYDNNNNMINFSFHFLEDFLKMINS